MVDNKKTKNHLVLIAFKLKSIISKNKIIELINIMPKMRIPNDSLWPDNLYETKTEKITKIEQIEIAI